MKTVERFKLQGLQARLVTYKHYWKRILTQMENGTYRRDVNRASRRQAAIEEAAARTEARMEEASAETAGDSPAADKPARPRPKRPGGGVSVPDGVTSGEVRALFKELVAAKRAAGESVAGLTYGSLVQKLAKSVPKIRDRHGCDGVQFEVTTTGGKVKLKAKPRIG